MGLTLLDSSVVVGLLYADDALHAASVAALEAEVDDRQHLALSAVSWSEVLTGVGLQGAGADQVRAFLYKGRIAIIGIDQAVAEYAAELRVDHYRRSRGGRLKTPDALILATGAIHPRINRILAADAQWAKVPIAGATVTVVG